MLVPHLRSLVVLSLHLSVCTLSAQPGDDRMVMAASTRTERSFADEQASIRAWLGRLHELRLDATSLAPLSLTDPHYPSDVTIDTPDLHTVRLTTVMFGMDSVVIDSTSRLWLDEVSRVLQEHPGAHVTIEAHTDDRGSNAWNDTLSWRRAEAVKAHLIAQGVAPTQVSASGYGERFPLAPNTTDAGRRRNRRVELRISMTE